MSSIQNINYPTVDSELTRERVPALALVPDLDAVVGEGEAPEAEIITLYQNRSLPKQPIGRVVVSSSLLEFQVVAELEAKERGGQFIARHLARVKYLSQDETTMLAENYSVEEVRSFLDTLPGEQLVKVRRPHLIQPLSRPHGPFPVDLLLNDVTGNNAGTIPLSAEEVALKEHFRLRRGENPNALRGGFTRVRVGKLVGIPDYFEAQEVMKKVVRMDNLQVTMSAPGFVRR